MGNVIGGIISGIGDIYGGVQNRNMTRPLIKGQTRLADAMANVTNLTSQQITPWYARAAEGYDPAFQHYARIASGDRSTIMGELAQPIADIGTKYRSLMQATGELMPRGGRSASFNAEIPFRAADDTQALIANERANAYPNLMKASGLAADVASAAAGGSTGAGRSGGALFGGALDSQNASNAAYAAALKSGASSLFDAYKTYSNGKKSGTGTNDGVL